MLGMSESSSAPSTIIEIGTVWPPVHVGISKVWEVAGGKQALMVCVASMVTTSPAPLLGS